MAVNNNNKSLGSTKKRELKAMRKCYENKERDWGYKETEPMGGHDPYSSSKGCAELVTSAYRRSFFVGTDTASLASARAGNVIGGGDWSKNRLIPDCMKMWLNNKTPQIRNPNSTRPWQHVLEPLSGYLLLGSRLLRIRVSNAYLVDKTREATL